MRYSIGFMVVVGSIFAVVERKQSPTMWLMDQTWHNWARDTECHPEKVFFPTSLEQAQSVVREANAKRVQIRAIGSGHSMNDLACSEGYLVNTDYLDDVLSIDRESGRVTVQCGIKIKDLVKVLKHEGLALENQGFITDQSIVGALATGTHGTGNTGILSDRIIGMQIINSRGELITISADSDSEMLPYARIHLGAFGLVYSVTLQCVPLFVLKHKKKKYSWDYVLEHYRELVDSNDYFMVMGHPLSENTLAYIWNRTSKSPTHHYDIKLQQKLMQNKYFNYFSAKVPHWLPGLTDFFFEHFFTLAAHRTIREYSYKTLSPVKNAQTIDNYAEEEISVPVEYFAEVVKEFEELYRRYKKQYDDFEIVGLLVCRFVKGSELSALSPAYGRDSAYISFNTLNIFPAYEQFFNEFEDILMSKYEGRPHWGKFNDLDQDKVRSLYGERVDEFNRLRAQFDPNNIFANDYITRLFG